MNKADIDIVDRMRQTFSSEEALAVGAIVGKYMVLSGVSDEEIAEAKELKNKLINYATRLKYPFFGDAADLDDIEDDDEDGDEKPRCLADYDDEDDEED